MLPQGELSADTPGNVLDRANHCSFSWIIVAELCCQLVTRDLCMILRHCDVTAADFLYILGPDAPTRGALCRHSRAFAGL